jgi:phenylacetic acid degradation operon negative regulatory protein
MQNYRNADELARALLGRPLSARSVIASLLLGRYPPRASSALLVRWCELFGIREGAARVALSRMVAAGELTMEQGVYELAGRVRARQGEQDVSLAGPGPWNGEWVMYVVRPGARTASERVALREAAQRLRLGELREGVWTRPDNLAGMAATAPDAELMMAAADTWRARPEDGLAIVARLFPAEPLAVVARRLAERLVDAMGRLEPGSGDRLAEAFVIAAAAVHLLRRDPVLPETLASVSWPAAELRDVYRGSRSGFDRAIAAWWAEESLPVREAP